MVTTAKLVGRGRGADWLPAMEPAVREKGYRNWRKAAARTVDWVDEDGDD